MDEAMAVVMSRDSVAELNHLLDLMDRAAADPKGSPITMDVLFSSGFTQHGLGGAHAALRDALAGGDPVASTPRRPAPRPPAADPAPAPQRPAADLGYEDISEEEKQTALLEEVVDVLETVKMVLIAVAVVAMLAVVVAAVALAT